MESLVSGLTDRSTPCSCCLRLNSPMVNSLLWAESSTDSETYKDLDTRSIDWNFREFDDAADSYSASVIPDGWKLSTKTLSQLLPRLYLYCSSALRHWHIVSRWHSSARNFSALLHQQRNLRCPYQASCHNQCQDRVKEVVDHNQQDIEVDEEESKEKPKPSD